MPRPGRSAWHISCATAATPSRRATPSSPRACRRCCCAPSCWPAGIATWPRAPATNIAVASNATSTPSWRSLRPTATACDCASDTACCASTSSPSSTSLKSPPTTIRPSAISVTPPPTGRSPAASAPTGAPISLPPSAPSSAPPHDAASMPTRPSATPYRVTPSSPQVEQIPRGLRLRSLLHASQDEGGKGQQQQDQPQVVRQVRLERYRYGQEEGQHQHDHRWHSH